MKNNNLKNKKTLTEEQLNEFIGGIVKWIFGKKSKKLMQLAAKDPKFKDALEDYVKGTNEFRNKLKDIYGVTDLDKLPRI
jgi:hypothetical protein